MKSPELRPDVANLAGRIRFLLGQPLERDPAKLTSLAESLQGQFEALSDPDKSQTFTFLIGLLWGLQQNVAGLSSLLKPDIRHNGLN